MPRALLLLEDQTDRDELARAVRTTAKRPRLSTMDQIREIVRTRSCTRVNGQLVDLFSASAIVKVHDALNEANRAKFAALPVRKMAAVAMKLIS